MRFEDLRVWQAARKLTSSIYSITGRSELNKDFSLKDQMRRAAISVMSNIAEGHERDGNKELRQFLSVAKGSAGELRSQVYIALDAGYLEKPDFESLQETSQAISRMLSSLITNTNTSEYSGRKLKR